ncbi:unnamed protein product [Brassica rapa]|uniref:Protein arginine methyltransferase NDUFAF7 n=2 Tax=Brassica TaxID=3705 RepID=A0A816TFH0_BRANA|nr:unnamed protein product [Brassica napus]CAG7877193.1 unnamed protein product [Brassica rapa]
MSRSARSQWILTQEMAKRIGSDGGGAFIINYGKDGIISYSLQAIREHKFVNILDNPGSADVSAYVDFPSIKHSAEEASEPSPLHTTTIVEKCTLKFVDDYKHMLCQATEPVSTFLEYISLNDSFIDLLPCL